MEIKLSVVIITLNEEKNLERCINSVAEVADEIVVLDSFSTDKTEEICKKYNVKFFQHKFDGHIEQKNRALAYSSNNYVLSMDADEALSPKLIESIKQIKKDCKYDGYYFNRLNNYCGKWIKHTSWYPDKKLRLWDFKKGKWTGINPHDKYEMGKDAKLCFLEGDLMHYTYPDINSHIKQISYFTDISSTHYFKEGKKAGLFKIVFSPGLKFFKEYILKLGFLDGYYGFIVSILSAYATLLKYVKLRELYRK